MTGILKEERIGGQRLLLGDCLEVMPLLGRFDAVVTDPPYGIEDLVGGYGRQGRTIKNDTNVAFYKSMSDLAINMTDVMLSFYSARNTPEIMDSINQDWYKGEIIWDKKAPGMGRGIRYQHENIAVSIKNDAKLKGDCFSVMSVYRAGGVHPHEKPVILMEMLIKLCGQTILDPFMGSGTTLVACQRLGRQGTGIELDPDYFDIACRRVDEATRQPDMFVQASQPAPTQESLL